MCGICGALRLDSQPDLEDRVDLMNRALIHRGPDSQGQFARNGASLAVRRLAVIDLKTGDQPIANEDQSLWIVFNGEIYNYRELAGQLQQQGHRFRTKSDTETVLHAYEEYGTATPQQLKGMFAFAIFDTRDRSLFLARDRFGEKPLFYYPEAQGLVFSSELRSLMEWPDLPRKTDHEALAHYLRVGFTPTPLTMFQSIYELPPGCWLRWSNGQVRTQEYYTPDYHPAPELEDEKEAIEAVREALTKAVRRQMVSDVPLGAFLSGGIDSSAVVATLQALSPEPIKTFTIRFEEATYDESPIARAVAQHLGTDHREIKVANAGFLPEDLWRIIDHVGAPFADSSAIPTFVLSKHVREEVTVCLTGDGGDEMFGGYTVFPWALKVEKLGRLPHPLLSAANGALGLLGHLPATTSFSGLRKVRRALDAAGQQGLHQFVTIQSLFLSDEMSALVTDRDVFSTACGELPRLVQLPKEAESWTPLRKLMYFRVKHNLPQDMLIKIDRMSMANSLELRAPMLDVEVAEVAMKLPDKYLIKGGVGKYILRESVRPLLPQVVFSHPKTGFSIPLHRFQNQAFIELAQELLSDRSGPLGLLNAKAVERICQLGLRRKRDHLDVSVYRATHQLWALIQLAAWGQRFHVRG